MSTTILAATSVDTTGAADTWGISGPQFLGWYVVLGLGVLGLVGLVTTAGRRPGSNAISAEDLTPVQLGLLSGGETLAVTVALSDLRRHGLVDVTGCPTTPVDPAGRPLLTKPTLDLDPVTRGVHDTLGISRVSRLAPSALVKRPVVTGALADERRRLEAARLLTSRPHRVAYLVAGALGAGFVALGVVRAVAGDDNHKPIGFLLVLVAAGAVSICALIVRSGTPRLTRAGKLVLRELRDTNQHLSPTLHPSWSTYGGRSLVTATALFGGAVMFTADPVFAQSVNMRDEETGGLGTVGNGGWSWGGNGNNSGGGCGGGSSCGGGGGCGGGGCGG